MAEKLEICQWQGKNWKFRIGSDGMSGEKNGQWVEKLTEEPETHR